MMWWNGDSSWWAWLAMTGTMLAFWGLIAWAIVAFFRSNGDSRPRSPEVLLAERFAKGEIDEDEYSRRLAVLEHPRGRSQRPNRFDEHQDDNGRMVVG